jgi:CIC family chloride channel protein
MLGGLLVGFMALQLPQVLGMGYGAVTDAMQNRLPLLLMFLLTVGKFIATILSYSSGTAGGLFAPALFIGSMLGGSLAAGMNAFTPLTIASPGAFALVGMGAVFVGIIRTPITSILIIFEMTNDYALILPLMLANMTSYSLARFFEPHSVYDAILAANNVHLPSGQDHVLLEELTAEDAMDRQPLTVGPDTSVADVATLLEQHVAHGVPVVTPDQRLLGVVTLTDVRQVMRREQHDKPGGERCHHPASDFRTSGPHPQLGDATNGRPRSRFIACCHPWRSRASRRRSHHGRHCPRLCADQNAVTCTISSLMSPRDRDGEPHLALDCVLV